MLILAMTLTALAQAATDTRAQIIQQKISAYCKGSATCIADQKEGLRHFLGIMTLFDPPSATARRCLAGSTKAQLTDWVGAASCLRTWSKSQPHPMRRR